MHKEYQHMHKPTSSQMSLLKAQLFEQQSHIDELKSENKELAKHVKQAAEYTKQVGNEFEAYKTESREHLAAFTEAVDRLNRQIGFLKNALKLSEDRNKDYEQMLRASQEDKDRLATQLLEKQNFINNYLKKL